MAFSLSNWFKGKPGEPGSESGEDQDPRNHPAAPAAATPTTPATPPSVRTVVPSTPQAQQPPVNLRAPSARSTVPVPPPRLAVAGKATSTLPPSRKVSFAPGSGIPSGPTPANPTLPPRPSASPTAFKPQAPDVTVSLEIGDFLDRLPPAFLQPGAFDRQKKVEFRASELYSDLSKGRASVPASVIYQRCPEIFSRPVTATEDVEVPLPLQKLVEQMGMALSTRTDQVEEENVGEIETPFLQVAMEDNARLPAAAGSAAGAVRAPVGLSAVSPFRPTGAPVPETNAEVAPTRSHRTGQISTISPIKVPLDSPAPSLAPPTSATAGPIIPGKRPPSTVRASVAGGKIRLSGPAVTRVPPVPQPGAAASQPIGGSRPGTHSQRINLPITPTSPSHQVAKKTARIQIPPISLRPGGASATPRPGPVPPKPDAAPPAAAAQSMPGLRPNTGKEAPPSITFRTSPPPPSVKPVPHSFAPPRAPAFPPPAFPVAPPPVAAPAAAVPAFADDRKIELGLAAILRSLPSSMLAVEASSVPDDERITLPFALIEPQLSLGRVTIKREVFVRALPPGHDQVLSGEAEPADIPLPLQEVFQHLPTSALTIRPDQVVEETGSYYPTPFSQKADEDARRFGASQAVAPAPAAVENDAANVAEPPMETSDATASDTVTDVPLDQPHVPGPSVDLEPPTDSAVESRRDIPLDPVQTPATSIDVESPVDSIVQDRQDLPLAPVDAPVSPGDVAAPADSATDSARDIPLDLGGGSTAEPPPDAAETTSKASSEIPVEARDTTREDAVQPNEGLTPAESQAPTEPESSSVVEALPDGKSETVPPSVEVPAAVPEAVPAPAAGKTEEPESMPAASTPETVRPVVVSEASATIGKDAAAKPVESPALPVPPKETPAVADHPARAADSVLQTLFMTEDELDAKTIVKLVCQLPGVSGCAIMFEDGLRLAGNFPAGDTEGFSAMSAPFYKRAVRFVSELELGLLQTFTLYTDNGLLSFFMHDNICVSVRHTGRGFLPGVREKVEIVTRELARKYTAA